MNTFIRIYICLSITILLTSCKAKEEDLVANLKNYELEYSIESNVKNISKIVYTDISGNKIQSDKIEGNWKIRAKGTSGNTIKLEVYGEFNDNGDSDISLRISAANAKEIVERRIVKNKMQNTHFHYYLLHVLN